MEDTQTKKFIATYARVSTARQEEEGTIATQISAIKDFADKNGYTIVQEYKDDGWSGDIIARPSLDQLRMDAKKKIWDAVLFYDPDRLARRYSYQELVMDELRELGVEPLFVTVAPSKNSEDKLMYGVRGVFAEYERVKIAERFRLGKVRKAKEGHIILTEAPYGYDFVTKTVEKQGYLRINETEAKIVRDIFKWVASEGLTLRSIVRRLQELGTKPRKSKRGVWNTSTLSTLVRNRTYMGEGHYGASYATVPLNPIKKEIYKKVKKTSRRMKPEGEWIKIATPVIIDRDLFEKAQQQLKRNFELCVRNRKNDYLVAGKIWCTCGERRAGEGPMHGKHLYYRCTNRVKHYPLPRTCLEGGLNARVTDKLVWKGVAKYLSSSKLLEEQVQSYLEDLGLENNTPAIDISLAEKEIIKLKDRENRYVRAYGDGIFSIEQFKQYVDPIKEKVRSFEEQIAKAKVSGNRLNKMELPKRDKILSLAQRAAKFLPDLNFNAKKEIVKDIIIKIIGNQKEAFVSGAIPVEYFNYAKFKTINRNSGVAECG